MSISIRLRPRRHLATPSRIAACIAGAYDRPELSLMGGVFGTLQVADATRLLDAGTISNDEYARLNAKALA